MVPKPYGGREACTGRWRLEQGLRHSGGFGARAGTALGINKSGSAGRGPLDHVFVPLSLPSQSLPDRVQEGTSTTRSNRPRNANGAFALSQVRALRVDTQNPDNETLGRGRGSCSTQRVTAGVGFQTRSFINMNQDLAPDETDLTR